MTRCPPFWMTADDSMIGDLDLAVATTLDTSAHGSSRGSRFLPSDPESIGFTDDNGASRGSETDSHIGKSCDRNGMERRMCSVCVRGGERSLSGTR